MQNLSHEQDVMYSLCQYFSEEFVIVSVDSCMKCCEARAGGLSPRLSLKSASPSQPVEDETEQLSVWSLILFVK